MPPTVDRISPLVHRGRIPARLMSICSDPRRRPMSIKRIARASCCAGALVAALWASAASSQAASTLMEEMTYRPIDSIQYDFGSKATSGYFVQQAARCVVYLMVYEKPDPDAASWRSATRIRLVLNPGETAGLDSE